MPANPEQSATRALHYNPGQRLPTPANFPIQWTNPGQARMYWTLDKTHFPDPMLPLPASLRDVIFEAPFNRAAEQYALPIRLATLYVNTYLYLSITPVGLPPDFVLKGFNLLDKIAPGLVKAIQGRAVAAMSQKYLAHLDPVIEQLGEHWADEWLPELKEHLAYCDNFDLHGTTSARLLPHFEATLTRLARIWEIHFLIVFPTFLALSQFSDFYHTLFGRKDSFASFRLLQGFDNVFLQADRGLWRLSRQALTMPKVKQTLADLPAEAVIDRLNESPEGQIFLAEFQVYLTKYGQRGHSGDGLSQVSWLEDPTPALRQLQDYLGQSDRDLEAELAAQAVGREQAVAQIRRRLKLYAQGTVSRFETLLKAAQAAVVLHEEHNYWIDQRAMVQTRQVVLALGRTFVETGILEQPADIFYLTLEEVRDATQQQPSSDPRAAVALRRAEIAEFAAVDPPPAIGAIPLMPMPDDPLGRSLTKVFGALPMPEDQSPPSRLLQGTAASPGLVRGRARIIHSPAGVDNVQEGDILVAEAILPTWTPLFATASAAITETGGILSHTAIMAREYGIPAVVALRSATTYINEGQMVEVDGTAGVVRLLD